LDDDRITCTQTHPYPRCTAWNPEERGIDMNTIKRLCFAASTLAALFIAGGASWRL
jgi:hypothetical protein